MTLYTHESLINLKQPCLHALVIGAGEYPYISNNRDFTLKPLTETPRSARRIAEWLATEYCNPSCPLGSVELLLSPGEPVIAPDGSTRIEVEQPTLENVKTAYRLWKDRSNSHPQNIALLYFAGHGIATTNSNSLFLLLEDFAQKPYELWTNCLNFEGLRVALRGWKTATQIYLIDACRDVPIDVAKQLNPHGWAPGRTTTSDLRRHVNSYTYFAAGWGQRAYAPENKITFFSEALLKSLDGAAAELKAGRRVVTLGSLGNSIRHIMAELGERSGQPLDSETQLAGGDDVDFHFPGRVPTRNVSRGSALEEALGYAIIAFRDYLNQNVVENVELIYFLSYDVWDGCLLYDGLVHDSIEQRLLNYIRYSFLDRDRLRSKYEQSSVDELGAAGKCFHEALKSVSATEATDGERDPLAHLWYIGDLAAYDSEYRAFDRLLGLVSCLYIPVVGEALIPVSSDQGDRRPAGGILMAASRHPYGLKPHGEHATELWEQFKSPARVDDGAIIDKRRRFIMISRLQPRSPECCARLASTAT